MTARRRALRLCVLAAVLTAGAPVAHAADTAHIVAEKQIEPRQIELTIETPAFAGPTHVDVDLPTGYDADPAKRWPVTYVLAGTMNTYRTFNSFVDGLKLTEGYPSIIVSPNGDSGYWSDWFNAGAFGPPMYETYVAEQLIPLIDQRFRTVAERSQRAVLGISMGGYGSAMMAARHPDLFVAAATLSGAVDSNLPTIAAAVSASPTFQGADADAIYGPRSEQEIRWHGHNPTDLANNLPSLDLQVRTADGTPNPGLGEDPASADTVSCVIEGGVHMATVSFHETLDGLKIPHLYKDYGAGCHTRANFKRELTDTFAVFATVLADPPAAPTTFDHASIEPAFSVFGWDVAADANRALEFLRLTKVGRRGLTLTGSGTTTVTTPPLFRGLRRVDVGGAAPAAAVPDASGRLRLTVDLGPADTVQENTSGADPAEVRRSVTFAPHAVVSVTRVRSTGRGLRVCARALGGTVTARLRVPGATKAARATLRRRASCRLLPWRDGPAGGTLRIAGTDGYGHAVAARRTVPAP